MNPLRLEYMTVFDAAPPAVIDIAEALAIPFVSVFLTDAMPGAKPIRKGDVSAFLSRLRDSPVAVDTAEAFALPADPAEAERGLALAAELGAKSVVALNFLSQDVGQMGDALAGFAALAGRHGLKVSLEPIAMSLTRTPDEAAAAIARSGAGNVGITIDLLHIVRTGTPIAAIAKLDPGLISSAQICDGPAVIDPALAIEEAGYERGIPGTGAFPIDAFLRALPPGTILGMEVPLKTLRESGVSPQERTRRVVEATRRLQRAAAGNKDKD